VQSEGKVVGSAVKINNTSGKTLFDFMEFLSVIPA
jgi:hypothetical protein